MEALARALPPSLTELCLDSKFGLGSFAAALGRGMRCGAGSQCGAWFWARTLLGADRLGRATSARSGGLELVVEGRLLAACSQPNRRCGCEGAGARTAAESDETFAQRYVRRGLVCCGSRSGHALRCRVAMRCVVLGAVVSADLVGADRLGRAASARNGGLGSRLRVSCSRLAVNQIGEAGVKALACALPPSLTTLYLDSTFGVGSLAWARLLWLSVGACAAVRGRNVLRGAGPGPCWGGSPWEGGQCAQWWVGVAVEGRLLAACREPNRRCGCGGAGARTAAESDDAPSQRYVRRGLACCGSRSGHALQCGVGMWCVVLGSDLVVADRLGRATIAGNGGLGSRLRVGCSRLAENDIGEAGVEALARALPPSLTELTLGGTCGVGSFAAALGRGMRFGARSQRGAWRWARTLWGRIALGGRPVARNGGLGSRLRVGWLAACRQPNRRCGCEGAGARTAAESDDAPSQRYVRRGLVCCGSRSGHALRCGVGTWCVVLGSDLVGADRLGRAASARNGGLGSRLRVGLLAACSQPNRSCGCGGAGARTAAESDVALSQRYVRRGLVCCRSRSAHALRCGIGMWCVVLGSDLVVADRLGRAASARNGGLGSRLRVGWLAACSQRHRRCGCEGAGARTAAESDDALSQRYVRRGLACCGSRSGHALRCGVGRWCVKLGSDLVGGGSPWEGDQLRAMVGWSSWLRVGWLAACRQPNRRCGCEGAGARTAAESDGAPSQRYVRRELVCCGSRSGHALRCGIGCGAWCLARTLWWRIALGGRPVRGRRLSLLHCARAHICAHARPHARMHRTKRWAKHELPRSRAFPFTRNEPIVHSAGNRIGTAGACVLFKSLTVCPMSHPPTRSWNRTRFCLCDQAWTSFSLLDLVGNQIESLPQDCANLPDGMELNLWDNPLVAPPVDIATQGLARIKLWLGDRRTQQRRPLDHMRVCFVGYGGAGKTTFAKLLTDGAAATCAAVQSALPIREWPSAQVDAWIRAGPIAATPAERQFLETLANALADIEPDGEFLVDVASKWDAEAVLRNTSNVLTDTQVERWWPRFQDRVRNHERKGYSSTMGIDVWELTLPGGLQVKIVDFAGQMEYYVSHGMFVALHNVLYVLVSKAAPKGNLSDCQIDEALYWVGYLRSSMSIARVHGAGDDEDNDDDDSSDSGADDASDTDGSDADGSGSVDADGSGPRRPSSQSEDGAVARVLLAVTHTDAIEPKYEPAALLHILGQRVDELCEAANDPPGLLRTPVCVPRYDDPVTADEARSCLIRAIEQQVPDRTASSHSFALEPLALVEPQPWFGARSVL